MIKHPPIKSGSWITVENHDCVVKQIYEDNSEFGICLVVYKKEKPTTHDVDWDGEKWFFPERSDFGGYPAQSDPFVYQLKKGKE